MKKSYYLICLFFIVQIFSTDYYVSNSGSDENNGLTPETAWATIEKVNSQTFEPGDSILFEAGGIWRETLSITNSGNGDNFITYSKYGFGKNPLLLGSEKAEGWTETSTANIWQSATQLDNYSEEYYPGRIYFWENDSISWGQYKSYNTNFTNLNSEYDYTVNGNTYYIFSTVNPNSKYDAVEVTQRSSCISIPDHQPQSYLIFDGIDFMHSRMFGFNAGYPAYRGATDLVFKNCNIGYIGAQPSGAAYGLSVWHSNFLVENSRITDCGRRGISLNLYMDQDPGEQRNIKNIIIRNNVFKRGYHTTALDLSSQLTTMDTIRNVYFYNNIVDDSDFDEICDNCGSNQVFFQNGDGESYINNIYVVGNVFIQSTARNILFEGPDTSYVWHNTIIGHNPNITENPYANVVWNSDNAVSYYQNNILYDNLPDNAMQNQGVFIYETFTGVFAEKDYNLYYSMFPKADRNFSAHRLNSSGGMGYWNTNEWEIYLAENSLFEQNSPSPQDPSFSNYGNNDFKLTESSAARFSGITLPDIIVTDPFGGEDNILEFDISGHPRNRLSPSIGAYEYINPLDAGENNNAENIDFTLHQNYPNPFNPTTTIEYSLSAASRITLNVFNILGQKVATLVNKEQPVGNYKVKFDGSNLASGIYIYTLSALAGAGDRFQQSKKLLLLK